MVKSKVIEHAMAIAAINAIFSIENPVSIKKPNSPYSEVEYNLVNIGVNENEIICDSPLPKINVEILL